MDTDTERQEAALRKASREAASHAEAIKRAKTQLAEAKRLHSLATTARNALILDYPGSDARTATLTGLTRGRVTQLRAATRREATKHAELRDDKPDATQ